MMMKIDQPNTIPEIVTLSHAMRQFVATNGHLGGQSWRVWDAFIALPVRFSLLRFRARERARVHLHFNW